jgi:tetratricopeptide (TPR) repeat protein
VSATLDRKLRQANAALAAGDAPKAEGLCREILRRAPRHPHALQLAASARLQQGDRDGATELLRRALESDPDNRNLLEGLGFAALQGNEAAAAESWLRRAIGLGSRSAAVFTWLGLALSRQGRHAEATEAFREAVAADPGDPGAQLNLGNALARAGMPDLAIASYERALGLRPDYPEALIELGSVLKLQGKLDDALARFRHAIALRPDYAEAHENLGGALLQAGRAKEAADSFRRAIALQPENADYIADLGHAMFDQLLWDQAAAQYERALALKPDYPETLNSLGSALREMERLDEAAERIRSAIALRPDYVQAHENLGLTLARLGSAEADAAFGRAIALAPDDADRYLKFGNTLLQEDYRWEEAIAQYTRSLELKPGYAQAEFWLGMARLFRGEFEAGWRGYERRLEMPEYRTRHFRQDIGSLALFERLRRWLGPGEPGVSDVAIWYEQGIGDWVLFSTLLPELIATGVPFFYEMDKRLIDVYRRAFPGVRFVAKQDPPHESLQRASRVLGTASLAALFRRSRESFARQPQKLLAARPERIAHYRQILESQGPGLKVALSWRSARRDSWVRRKTIPMAALMPLLTLPVVEFVDVQYGDTRMEREALQAAGVRLLRFDEVDYYNDLEELFAILEACDLLITTSNATAHFAGALGKRTWLIYLGDQAPFHYWADAGDHRSRWYPAVEIVSGKHLTDWAGLLEEVAARLGREARVESGNSG